MRFQSVGQQRRLIPSIESKLRDAAGRGRRRRGGGVENPSSLLCKASQCRQSRHFKCSSASRLMRHSSAHLHLIKAMIHFKHTEQSTVHLAAVGTNTLRHPLTYIQITHSIFTILNWPLQSCNNISELNPETFHQHSQSRWLKAQTHTIVTLMSFFLPTNCTPEMFEACTVTSTRA